jgi:hypothetical protein
VPEIEAFYAEVKAKGARIQQKIIILLPEVEEKILSFIK